MALVTFMVDFGVACFKAFGVYAFAEADLALTVTGVDFTLGVEVGRGVFLGDLVDDFGVLSLGLCSFAFGVERTGD